MSGPPQDAAMVEALIEDFQRSGLRELHVRTAEFELYLSSDADAAMVTQRDAAASQPAEAPTPPPGAHAAPARAAVELPAGTTAIAAPYLGTFYRSPKPGAPAYVEVGARVGPEDELCLVEVMKLFTAVRAGIAGTVEAVLASDGQMVEAGQPLFAIRAD